MNYLKNFLLTLICSILINVGFASEYRKLIQESNNFVHSSSNFTESEVKNQIFQQISMFKALEQDLYEREKEILTELKQNPDDTLLKYLSIDLSFGDHDKIEFEKIINSSINNFKNHVKDLDSFIGFVSNSSLSIIFDNFIWQRFALMNHVSKEISETGLRQTNSTSEVYLLRHHLYDRYKIQNWIDRFDITIQSIRLIYNYIPKQDISLKSSIIIEKCPILNRFICTHNAAYHPLSIVACFNSNLNLISQEYSIYRSIKEKLSDNQLKRLEKIKKRNKPFKNSDFGIGSEELEYIQDINKHFKLLDQRNGQNKNHNSPTKNSIKSETRSKKIKLKESCKTKTTDWNKGENTTNSTISELTPVQQDIQSSIVLEFPSTSPQTSFTSSTSAKGISGRQFLAQQEIKNEKPKTRGEADLTKVIEFEEKTQAPVEDTPIRYIGTRQWKVFDDFWNQKIGITYLEFKTMFEGLGGTVEESTGSSHVKLIYKDFKPGGTWRPHGVSTCYGYNSTWWLKYYMTVFGLTPDYIKHTKDEI